LPVDQVEAPAARAALLEREEELARVELVLEHAERGFGALVQVEGPPGIGKTRLLAAAKAAAQQREMDVLGARAGELERTFAFGVVRQLFERELAAAPPHERSQLLSGSAALAALAVGFSTPSAPAAATDVTFSVLHGLYWLSANLAARRPLLIAVDDLHWSDAASLRFLAYLAARIDELPIALVTAARPREPGAEQAFVDQLATAPTAEVIRPASLTVVAAKRVVADGLQQDVDDAFARACHAATGGNPFLLHELVGALRADGATTTAHDAPRVRELRPRTVSRSVMLRVARMPPAAREIAAAIAVLGDGVE
jgi:predicted ATPase